MRWRAAMVSGLVIGAATGVDAAKWVRGCPPPTVRMLHIARSADSPSVFIHPGHTMSLRITDAAFRHGAAFSTEPDGNIVEVTFTPIDGDPIPLPPFTATAASANTLHFPFPDPEAIVGRVLAGPVQVVVRNGDLVVVETRKYPVVLPPPNDVAALTTNHDAVDVLATIDVTGRLWVPLRFGGFGIGTPMPGCPADMTPKVALAVAFSIDRKDGDAIPHTTATMIKKGILFLGDFVVGDTNLYGAKLASGLNVKAVRGLGVALCGINDALDLVLMIPTRDGATGPRSAIIPVVRDGSPLRLHLRDVSATPELARTLGRLEEDSFGTPCLTAAP